MMNDEFDRPAQHGWPQCSQDRIICSLNLMNWRFVEKTWLVHPGQNMDCVRGYRVVVITTCKQPHALVEKDGGGPGCFQWPTLSRNGTRLFLAHGRAVVIIHAALEPLLPYSG